MNDPMAKLLVRAIAIAADAHAEQVDKAGRPFILHPLRVMMRMETDEERVVAVLHDIVEEADWTFDRLRREGFPERIVCAIDHLTVREDDPYDAFVVRAAADPLARSVKRADLEDNMDVCRLPRLTADDVARLAKYHKAWRAMED